MAIWSPIIKNLFTIGPAKASWSGSPRAPRHHLAARPVLRETQAGALHRTRPATANWPGSCGTAAPTCCRSPPTRRTTASSGGRSRPEPGDATTSKAGRLTPARLRRGQIGVFRQPLDRPSARTGVHRLNGGSSAGQVSTHPTPALTAARSSGITPSRALTTGRPIASSGGTGRRVHGLRRAGFYELVGFSPVRSRPARRLPAGPRSAAARSPPACLRRHRGSAARPSPPPGPRTEAARLDDREEFRQQLQDLPEGVLGEAVGAAHMHHRRHPRISPSTLRRLPSTSHVMGGLRA